MDDLELLQRRDDDRVLLLAPDTGLFTDALTTGAALAPGQAAGSLLRLGRATVLRVPDGVHGTVVSAPPERVHEPVGFRTTLYEVAPFAEGAGSNAGEITEDVPVGLVVTAPQSGRFYHRPGLDEDAFVEAGAILEEGTPVGLIEVMKTFTHVPYRVERGLPARARVVRFVAGDGADVAAGEPLLEIEVA